MSLEAPGKGAAIRPSQWRLAAVIFALSLASLAYRLLVAGHLEQTSALFIGVPTLLALALTMTPRARSPLGIIMKGMTIGLLLSGVLLGEGFICILMASPLFYLVGLLIGLLLNRSRKKNQARLLALVFLLPQSLEGTHGALSFPRDESVRVERVVLGDPVDVERALSSAPVFHHRLPLYLRLGFPRPLETFGSGLAIGDLRRIHFGGGEGRPGDLVLEVELREARRVRFKSISDQSHVAHWLDWRKAEVSWEPLEKGRTKVVWTLYYVRRLDPAWYFGPWERYAVGLAGGYLIDNLATP